MAIRQPAPVRERRAPVANDGAIPPIWHEALWPAEWLSLRMSSVYRGAGIPRGDGSPVVLVPGFLCSDSIMVELYAWLDRVGYKPYLSQIGVNADCPGATAQRLTKTVERAHAETGRTVRLVGHSLGGIIARKVTLQQPGLVSQLIYLGAPIQGVHAHPAIAVAAGMLMGARTLAGSRDGCLTSHCRCGLADDVRRPLPASVEHAAIYTRGDGVVDWHDAQERDPSRNHEVGGTHIGLVYNPRAYRVLGHLLAGAPVV